jgi:NADPH-dependent curcumin reductase CurA
MVQNKGIIFKQVPQGLPVPGKDLTVEAREFDLEQAPPAGGITTKNFYASFDPYQRGRMRPANVKSYSPPFTLGEPITNGAVCKVIKSDHPNFKAGDLIFGGQVPTEEYSSLAKPYADMMRKLNNPHNLDLVHFLGALGSKFTKEP